MANQQNPEELYAAARNAKADLDKAQTKEEIIAVFKKHVSAVGYKSLGKMFTGQSPEDAVKKWADSLQGKKAETEKVIQGVQ